MRPHIHTPPLNPDCIVQDRLTRMTFTLHGKACRVATAIRAIAYAHRDRVRSVVHVGDARQVGGHTGRQGQVQTGSSEELARGFVRYSWGAKGETD